MPIKYGSTLSGVKQAGLEIIVFVSDMQNPEKLDIRKL